MWRGEAKTKNITCESCLKLGSRAKVTLHCRTPEAPLSEAVPEWADFDVTGPRAKIVVTGCICKFVRLQCDFKLLNLKLHFLYRVNN